MQDNNMQKMPSLEASEEELKREFQEIQKKRIEYQEQLQQESIVIQKQKQEIRTKKFACVVKAAVIVLVAGTCLFFFAAKSEATRMWWLNSVERIIGRNMGHVVDNDEHRVIYDFTEEQALAEVEDRTGIPMPELKYRPKGLIYDGFSFDESMMQGNLFYTYDKSVFHLFAYSTDGDSSYMWIPEGNVVDEKTVEADYAAVQLTARLEENGKTPGVIAEWKYHNYEYRLVGKVPFEEMEKIILNILY